MEIEDRLAKLERAVFGTDAGAKNCTRIEQQAGCFDWEKAKENMVETDCGITLCRENYYEGNKKHFTFTEAIEIEKEAKKHGLRLPTVVDFEKLYAFYGLGEDGEDTPQRFMDKLGLSLSGYYYNGSLYYEGSNGHYWSSSTYTSSANAYSMYFSAATVNSRDTYSKVNRFSVRFIKDEG